MPAPSLTYTLSNGATADADQVMQNFNDLLNALTDGTKDFSVSALTCAGTLTANGHVNLGNSSADDVTVTGSIASNVVPKTDGSYSLGSSSIGWANLYLSGNSNQVTLKASASTSGDFTLTLPTSGGTTGYKLGTTGSGTLAWYPDTTGVVSKSNENYTILDNDGYGVILVTTGSSTRTITLPSAANNSGRMITIKKIDSGSGAVSISGTIDGSTTGNSIYLQYGYGTLFSDGSNWYWKDEITEQGEYTPTFTNVANMASTSGERGNYFRKGRNVTVNAFSNVTATAASPTLTQIRISLPIAVSNFTSDNQVTGGGSVYHTATSVMPAYLLANQSNEEAEIRYFADTTSSRGLSCTFSYRIN